MFLIHFRSFILSLILPLTSSPRSSLFPLSLLSTFLSPLPLSLLCYFWKYGDGEKTVSHRWKTIAIAGNGEREINKRKKGRSAHPPFRANREKWKLLEHSFQRQRIAGMTYHWNFQRYLAGISSDFSLEFPASHFPAASKKWDFFTP